MTKKLLANLYDGVDLQSSQIQQIFNQILTNNLSEIEIAAVLIALKARAHNAEVFEGAAKAMLQVANPFEHNYDVVADCCGTGGDGHGLLNISTAVSFVVAACGVKVAKHGNRAVSSNSGSADVLEHLGIELISDNKLLSKQLETTGLTFLFAPFFHPAIKTVMPVRNALATRTIFNILGPLVNPARPNVQLMGVFSKDLCRPVAETLAKLGVENALVVHGSGLDEIAVHDSTQLAHLDNGRLTEYQLTPEEMGVSRHALESLKGGDAENNAIQIRLLFDGKGGAALIDAVAVNAAAVLMLAGKVKDICSGVEMAKQVITNGSAKKVLQALASLQEG